MTETTQHKVHKHVQQFCTVREDEADVKVDYQMCGKRKQFLARPDGDLMSYVFKSRPWADRIVAIAHNTKAFDILIILNRPVQMKLLPELLVMDGQKIVSQGGERHVVGQSKLYAHGASKIA